MLLDMRDSLLELGVDKHRIHFELFNTYVESKKEDREAMMKKYKGKIAEVKLRLDGKAMDFVLPFGGDPILDAALKQGADLPYACKGGVCCTCKAKLLEGNVEMEANYGLGRR